MANFWLTNTPVRFASIKFLKSSETVASRVYIDWFSIYSSILFTEFIQSWNAIFLDEDILDEDGLNETLLELAVLVND